MTTPRAKNDPLEKSPPHPAQGPNVRHDQPIQNYLKHVDRHQAFLVQQPQRPLTRPQEVAGHLERWEELWKHMSPDKKKGSGMLPWSHRLGHLADRHIGSKL